MGVSILEHQLNIIIYYECTIGWLNESLDQLDLIGTVAGR
jgi:hypothetical protein